MIVLKFMFDECIAAPIMRTLFANLPEGYYFEHVTDRFRSGTEDEDWLSQLEEEGGWIVITADRAKLSPRGKKLPEICRARKITHVMLSSTLHEKPSRIKAAALSLKWDDIALLHQKPQGIRALLRYRTTKKARDVLDLQILE